MINKDDLANYQKFGKLIAQGDYNLKGEAVVSAALLFKWYFDLGLKLKAEHDKAEAEKEIAKDKADVI